MEYVDNVDQMLRCIHGSCSWVGKPAEHKVSMHDISLLCCIMYSMHINPDDCLHSLLPPLSTASQHYQLRQRAHNRDIPERTGHLTDSNFLTHLVHKCTDFARRSFSYAAPVTWNSLPANITLSDSEHGFKRQLKTFLFQQSA